MENDSAYDPIETWRQEAKFGMTYIDPVLDGLPGNRVLEVGSGLGILLHELARKYPAKSFTGLEPFIDGFQSLDMEEYKAEDFENVAIAPVGYEDYIGTSDFDFIYAVNVFEHLTDWMDFLKFVSCKLTPGGSAMFLCPNYGFPYESHYRLPILWNKTITQRVFHRRIEAIDRKQNSVGLWETLNFVKAKDIQNAIAKTDLSLEIDTSISFELIDRLKSDKSFAERQKHIGRVVKILSYTGILQLFTSQYFKNFHPYMIIKLQKPQPLFTEEKQTL